MKCTLVDMMKGLLFVREEKENRGNRVEAIQKWCGGLPGQSWCCYLLTAVLDVLYQGKSPIPRLGACQDVYNIGKKNKWLVSSPLANDIFLYVDSNDHAHHIGVITIDGQYIGIAGNTSPDGQSSNGTGVFEHELISNHNNIKLIRLPKQ